MNKTFEQAKRLKYIELEQIEITKQLESAYVDKYSIQSDISNIEEEVMQLKNNIESSFINNIMKTIHIGKSYKIQQEIEQKIKKIENLRKQLNGVQILIKQLQEKNSKFLEILDNNDLQKYFNIEKDEIVITDWVNSSIHQKKLDSYKYKSIEDTKKVLIHSTDFFPKNKTILSNYHGSKILNKKLNYRGIEKEISFLSHRHTVHFTINARVQNTGDGEGNWDDAYYMIIDGYDIHKDEFESHNPSDSWTNGTSFKLSDDAIIMVRIQDKEKLYMLEEDLTQYNIIYYNGDPTKCLENFLQINGYDIFETDPNYSAHHHSIIAKQENFTTKRDKVLNFLMNNAYDGKETILLSEFDILMMLDIAFSTANTVGLDGIIDDKELENLLDEEQKEYFFGVARFLIGSGIKLYDNKIYTFKSDENILKDLEQLKKFPDKIRDIIDVELICRFYKKYKELRMMLDNMSIEEIKQLINKNSQKIKNEAEKTEEQSENEKRR